MPKPQLSKLSDDALLDTRLCDLDVQIPGTWLEGCIEQLYLELAAVGIRWRPHVWLSHGWFAKDGVPGFAVPFYLAHKRLQDLERAQMLEVEGGTHDWCMRILRHEAAHAIDTAYQLFRTKAYRKHFGNYAAPYPDDYRPNPASRNHVIHLDLWYAQSHPAEDFAETFAVWLAPGQKWRTDYAGWPVMRKLLATQDLLARATAGPVKVKSKAQPKALRTLKMTLRQHYRHRIDFECRDWPALYDRDLRRVFSADKKFARKPTAQAFLAQHRDGIRMLVCRWTGASALTIDRTLADMEIRCLLHGMHLAKPPAEARTDIAMMLAVQTMNHLHGPGHRVPL
jgi:hypothetical protein